MTTEHVPAPVVQATDINKHVNRDAENQRISRKKVLL